MVVIVGAMDWNRDRNDGNTVQQLASTHMEIIPFGFWIPKMPILIYCIEIKRKKIKNKKKRTLILAKIEINRWHGLEMMNVSELHLPSLWSMKERDLFSSVVQSPDKLDGIQTTNPLLIKALHERKKKVASAATVPPCKWFSFQIETGMERQQGPLATYFLSTPPICFLLLS